MKIVLENSFRYTLLIAESYLIKTSFLTFRRHVKLDKKNFFENWVWCPASNKHYQKSLKVVFYELDENKKSQVSFVVKYINFVLLKHEKCLKLIHV